MTDSFKARTTLNVGSAGYEICSLARSRRTTLTACLFR